MKHRFPTETGPQLTYRFSDQIGYLLRRAYQKHLAIFQSQTHDLQLTSMQFSTLCALRDAIHLSQHDLVAATGIDQATIRGIVDRLQKRGLISFSKDASDGRKVIYAATTAGLEALAAMVPRALTVTEETFGGLNPAERAALVFTLRKMIGEDAPDRPAADGRPAAGVRPESAEADREGGAASAHDQGKRSRARGHREG